MHIAGDGHDTPVSQTAEMWAEIHRPPPGSVLVTTLPSVSTRAQSDAEAQEIADGPRIVGPSAFTAAHVDAPPSGFVEVVTFPAESKPAHRDSEGHEISINSLAPSATTPAHMPLVGSLETNTSPPEIPAQNWFDGHDMPDGPENPTPSLTGADHADAPPAGIVEVTTLPAWSKAMHKDSEAHVTPVRSA